MSLFEMELSNEDIETLYKISWKFDLISEGLRKEINRLRLEIHNDMADEIYSDLSYASAVYLHKILESTAYSYKMSEGTDPDFIYFVLGLEQYIEDMEGEADFKCTLMKKKSNL